MSHNDSTSVADGTTVIGGPMSNVGDMSYMNDSFPKKPSTYGKSSSVPGPSSKNLFETADYFDTERPFFIPIGKDGLIVALQKLDVQLRNVSDILCVVACAVLTLYSPDEPIFCQRRYGNLLCSIR